MNQAISDFFQLGHLRLIARVLTALRGLYIIFVLTPQDFGQYTIWLLFIFYFQFMDFGVLYSLERDIPHFNGRQDAQSLADVKDIGWSFFFILSVLASVGLGIVASFVFHSWLTGFLLGLYLLTDKLYRAYDTSSRIQFKYRVSGVAELFLAATSLLIAWYALPRWGLYGIFSVFILSALISAWFLYPRCPLRFRWSFDWKRYGRAIKGSLGVARVYYLYDFFQVVALTVLAWRWDKTTLGYFAFAFRIYQMFLNFFPEVMADVLRARMYFHSAQLPKGGDPFRRLFAPLGVYMALTALFWFFMYGGAAEWGIRRFFPGYVDSTRALIVLILALLPMGIVKVLGEFLCSRVYNRAGLVTLGWISGIIIQGICFFTFPLAQSNIVQMAPLIYLGSTILPFVIILWTALAVRRKNLVV